MNQIRILCKSNTYLTDTDIKILERHADQLPAIANLTGNDVFIDVLTRDETEALVVAWASPDSNSVYRKNVVGDFAYPQDEPAVYHTLKTGEINREIRGISQEGVPIAQTVVPVRNEEKVIAVLIMEKDISRELKQEEQVELLSQTAESLSSTLMYLSRTESTFEEWVKNGLFVLNKDAVITYANKEAARYFQAYSGIAAVGSKFSILIPGCPTVSQLLDYLKNQVELSFFNRLYILQGYSLVTNGQTSGCVVSLQDITDIRKKEQELNAKSTIIREIHHRVKNNLQNVAALLRLQMRRADSEIIKSEFSASINRIVSIAMVHDVFAHEHWDTIDVMGLSQRILDSVLETTKAPNQEIKTRIEGQPVQLSSHQAVPFAMVINELVTNSLKHGVGNHPQGRIDIIIKENQGQVELYVTDDGPEPIEPFDQGTASQLGLQIVESLVTEQLDGSFGLERLEGRTQAWVHFKKT